MRAILVLLVGAIALAAPETESKLTEPDESRPANVAVDVRWAPIQFSNYSFAPGSRTIRPGNAVLLSLEWLPFHHYGKAGIGAGAGFFVQPNQDLKDGRTATLSAFPLDIHASYYFDYLENQLIVPYASVGASWVFLQQSSPNGASIPGTQSYQGWEYSFGGEICLTPIDRNSAHSLRRLLGIERTYLTVSYQRSQPLNRGVPDLSYDVYRLGFRVEI